MKIFLRFCFLFAILFTSFGQHSFAQDISPEQAKELILKNAPFLNLTKTQIENSLVSNAYIDNGSGLQLIYLQQSYQDVPVFNALQVIALKSDKFISLSGDRIYNIEEKAAGIDARPSVSAKQAVSYAARSLNINLSSFAAASLSVLKTSDNKQKVEFASSGISQENIVSQLFWVKDEITGKVNLTWQVKILPLNSSDYWLVFIDALKGTEIKKLNLTVNCSWDKPEDRKMHESHTNGLSEDISNSTRSNNGPSDVTASYTVIPFAKESLSNSGFVKVFNPWLMAGADNNAITLKWHNDGTKDYNITRGNNVFAVEDTRALNLDSGKPAVSLTPLPNLSFNFPYNGDSLPSTYNNRAAAITNLFYWNNIMHDITYQYGFDEVSGNFQNVNFARGGKGNDYVNADAQDGSGRNNANFSTPADGNSPRMQMFLFNGVNKKLFKINSPPAIEGYKNAVEGGFSPYNLLINVGPITGDLVLYQDNAAGTLHQACGSPVNSITGKIALIDRGVCSFAIKVKNAQNAGAKAVVVINNDAADSSAVIIMGGVDSSVTIPAVMISLRTGVAIKKQLENNVTVNVTLSGAKPNDLDGDFDNGIIAHEYTHGISNRLTGGPSQSACLSNLEQGGEGWSDYFALMVTTDWTTASVNDGPKPRSVGTYVLGEDLAIGGGIRTYPYSTDLKIDPWTYAGVQNSGGEVHDIGEIWASAIWDMTWNIIQIDGINPDLYNAQGKGGNSVAIKLVTLGMKLQPCRPGFLDARNAILKADEVLYNGKYNCAIWRAFARRGMGVNAKQGSSNSTTDQVQNFDIPSSAVIHKSADKVEVAQEDVITYTFTVKTQCEPIANYKIVDTLPANVTYVSGGTYNAANRTVSFDIASIAATTMEKFTFKVKVNSTTFFKSDTIFYETIPTNSIPSSFIATSNQNDNWTVSTEHHSPDFSLKSAGPATVSEQILTSAASYTIKNYSELSFWQMYNTEPGADAGVVELSSDNGITWIDAGPFMNLNGYNSIINTNTNLENKPAFSGTSNGWIQTIISLGSFEGKKVFVRFRFVTDEGTTSGGWYIDDILLVKKAAVYNVAKLFNGLNLASLSDTVTNINNSSLPLTWGTFTVEKKGSDAILNWTTLQEINTDKFIIERSTDGIHFIEIGIKNAAGYSNGSSNYSFIDNSPSKGVNNYRIKQTDRDGNYTYSEIRALTFDLASGLISISPNPSRGGTIMVKILGNLGDAKIVLVNAAGQVISKFNVIGEKNDLLLPALASGVYYLKITGENISSVEKLVIKK